MCEMESEISRIDSIRIETSFLPDWTTSAANFWFFLPPSNIPNGWPSTDPLSWQMRFRSRLARTRRSNPRTRCAGTGERILFLEIKGGKEGGGGEWRIVEFLGQDLIKRMGELLFDGWWLLYQSDYSWAVRVLNFSCECLSLHK